ncbi:unnamed protein product [marine sediment metagenome]|uniref:Uncharacterized protein n=1 Tax=marine sediment metagenome TaxID=412755 RepID=X0YYU6_9ZZZZ
MGYAKNIPGHNNFKGVTWVNVYLSGNIRSLGGDQEEKLCSVKLSNC